MITSDDYLIALNYKLKKLLEDEIKKGEILNLNDDPKYFKMVYIPPLKIYQKFYMSDTIRDHVAHSANLENIKLLVLTDEEIYNNFENLDSIIESRLNPETYKKFKKLTEDQNNIIVDNEPLTIIEVIKFLHGRFNLNDLCKSYVLSTKNVDFWIPYIKNALVPLTGVGVTYNILKLFSKSVIGYFNPPKYLIHIMPTIINTYISPNIGIIGGIITAGITCWGAYKLYKKTNHDILRLNIKNYKNLDALLGQEISQTLMKFIQNDLENETLREKRMIQHEKKKNYISQIQKMKMDVSIDSSIEKKEKDNYVILIHLQILAIMQGEENRMIIYNTQNDLQNSYEMLFETLRKIFGEDKVDAMIKVFKKEKKKYPDTPNVDIYDKLIKSLRGSPLVQFEKVVTKIQDGGNITSHSDYKLDENSNDPIVAKLEKYQEYYDSYYKQDHKYYNEIQKLFDLLNATHWNTVNGCISENGCSERKEKMTIYQKGYLIYWIFENSGNDESKFINNVISFLEIMIYYDLLFLFITEYNIRNMFFQKSKDNDKYTKALMRNVFLQRQKEKKDENKNPQTVVIDIHPNTPYTDEDYVRPVAVSDGLGIFNVPSHRGRRPLPPMNDKSKFPTELYTCANNQDLSKYLFITLDEDKPRHIKLITETRAESLPIDNFFNDDKEKIILLLFQYFSKHYMEKNPVSNICWKNFNNVKNNDEKDEILPKYDDIESIIERNQIRIRKPIRMGKDKPFANYDMQIKGINALLQSKLDFKTTENFYFDTTKGISRKALNKKKEKRNFEEIKNAPGQFSFIEQKDYDDVFVECFNICFQKQKNDVFRNYLERKKMMNLIKEEAKKIDNEYQFFQLFTFKDGYNLKTKCSTIIGNKPYDEKVDTTIIKSVKIDGNKKNIDLHIEDFTNDGLVEFIPEYGTNTNIKELLANFLKNVRNDIKKIEPFSKKKKYTLNINPFIYMEKLLEKCRKVTKKGDLYNQFGKKFSEYKDIEENLEIRIINNYFIFPVLVVFQSDSALLGDAFVINDIYNTYLKNTIACKIFLFDAILFFENDKTQNIFKEVLYDAWFRLVNT